MSRQPLPYITNNIIIGRGEVVAVNTDKGSGWVLPGNGITYSRAEAIAHAKWLDRVVSANLRKFNRRLFNK